MHELSVINAAPWPMHPIWSLVKSRDQFGGVLPLLSLSAQHGVRERVEGEGRAASDDTSGYRVVGPGDLVVNRLSARDGAFGVSRAAGLVSPAYWVLRSRSPEHGTRWLDYVLRSQHYRAEIARISKFMPPAQFDLPWEQFRAMPIPCPPLKFQRIIANYLDTETARIDELTSKKEHLTGLLEELRSALLENYLSERGINLKEAVTQPEHRGNLPVGWRVVPLGRVLRQLTNGHVGPTRDILVDEGVRYIQATHIKKGQITFTRRPYFVERSWHVARPRISLQPGDVLIVQTGDIGEAALVPDNFGPASCHALLIARNDPRLVSSDYLGLYLQSTVGKNELLRLATGALHPHLEFGIRSAPVLVPPLKAQSDLVHEVYTRRAEIDKTQRQLSQQLELLREHRQALITAAVTGELEISGATLEQP